MCIIDITLTGVYGSCFSLYQTGLTQMSDTVIGGSTGLGLSGGQVSCKASCSRSRSQKTVIHVKRATT